MTLENKKTSAAAFMKALERKCEELSKRQLIDAIMEMAADVPVRERDDFLERFSSAESDFDDGEASPAAETEEPEDSEASDAEEILSRIEALKEEIEERIEAIENGENPDDPEDYDYDDEDPDFVGEDQAEELEDFFLIAEDFFLSENFEDARRIYGALFELLDGLDFYRVTLSRIDLKEARGCHVRSVYETTRPEERVEAVAESMVLGKNPNPYSRTGDFAELPMFRDVEGTLPDEPKDRERFLEEWIGYLSEKPDERSVLLRLEALLLLKGAEAVAKAVREYGAAQPRGWLFWIEALKDAEDWTGTIQACKKALGALPAGRFRETAARHLVEACEKTNDDAGILEARREQFLSSATETNLLDFLTEASRQDVRDRELNDLLASHSKTGVFERDKTLHVKALLMAGSVGEALEFRKDLKPVGWSSSPAGLLFSSVLRILTDRSKAAVAVGEMFRLYAGRPGRYSYYSQSDERDKYDQMAVEEVEKGIGNIKPSAEEASDWLEWAEHIGCARIDHIVSNQHRGAYGSAALTLAALCEHYVLASDVPMARNLMRGFAREKYPRHTAFRNEVKDAISRSGPLKQIGVF